MSKFHSHPSATVKNPLTSGVFAMASASEAKVAVVQARTPASGSVISGRNAATNRIGRPFKSAFQTALRAWVLALVVLATTLSTAEALGQFQWQQRPVNGPSERTSHRMVYDSHRGVSVLFGGSVGVSYLADTWEWNGTTWETVPASGPPARNNHAMAYDALRHKTVLFGGFQALPPSFSAVRFSDTWEWDGIAWTQMNVSGPSGRLGHAMAYDSVRGVTVLFGGQTSFNPHLFSSEVWEWDGTNWTLRVAPGPSPSDRYGSRIAFDSARGVIVLFGGSDIGNTFLRDTWEWDGNGTGSWTLKSNTGPSARSNHDMAFDSTRGVTVLFGGYDDVNPNRLGDTWEWNGTAWMQRIASGPAPRESHTIVFDALRNRIVLFGGGSTNPNRENSDTWELCPFPMITAEPTDQTACSSAPAHFDITASGNAPVTYRWEIESPSQPGQWLALSTTAMPLACGGTAQASSPEAASTFITVSHCAGISAYRVRCAVSGDCGTTYSSDALLTLDILQSPPRIGTGLFYQASLGSLPDSQGWEFEGFGGTAQIVNPYLVLTNNCGYRAPSLFRWDDGQEYEARLRVPFGEVSNTPGLRAAYIGGADSSGSVVYTWIWSTGVGLSTHNNANIGTGLATIPFDAASELHTYKVMTNGTGATLIIDGIARISLPYVNIDPSFRSVFVFGSDFRIGSALTIWDYVQFGMSGQPTDAETCQSGTATFTVTSTGVGSFDFQWRKNSIPISVINNPSAGTATLTLVNVQNSDIASYDCVVSGCSGSVTSATASLTLDGTTCCPADLNGDGIVDFFDYLDFVDAFSIGSMLADVNHDEIIDFFDYLDFVDAFSTGC